MRKTLAALSVTVALCLAGNAQASPSPYPTPGIPNATTYAFTASSAGDITAYFAGSTASYDNALSLLVNGVSTGIVGLDNHSSSYGQLLDFGAVNAGDVLVFELINLNPGGIGPWYSDASMNSDGVNHVYSSAYAGDSSIPAGTYVAFEDLPASRSDFNYNDEDFVFTNVTASNNVPEPAGLALFGLGLAALGIRRRRQS